jgi:hypothetical protein
VLFVVVSEKVSDSLVLMSSSPSRCFEEFTMQTLLHKQGHASLKLQGCKANNQAAFSQPGKEMPRAGFGWTTCPRLGGFPVWGEAKMAA